MKTFNLDGVTVQFPFDPYDCQLDLMGTLVKALKSSSNALIESPTGTGKTLCLLCAVLAWREAYVARQQILKGIQKRQKSDPSALQDPALTSLIQKLTNAVTIDEAQDPIDAPPPKIFYASRTHSQLSQAVQELKRTAYNNVKISVLASREQMCFNPEVKALKSNGAQSRACRNKVSTQSCEYYGNYAKFKDSLRHNMQIHDIEELNKIGRDFKTCTYFLSKDSQADADVVFLPYNYLIDDNARKTQNIDVKNAILIFDEAHNVETSCSESSSASLTVPDITRAIFETLQCVSFSQTQGSKLVISFSVLQEMLEKYRESVESIPLNGANKEATRSGDFIYSLFKDIGVTFENFSSWFEIFDSAVELYSQLNPRSSNSAISSFYSVLKLFFKTSMTNDQAANEIIPYYKVYVSEAAPATTTGNSVTNSTSSGLVRTISYWCFSAGVTMRELAQRGKAKSVILASGTLTPLNSFASEMGIEFPYRLENPHVISSEQIHVSVVCKGPTGQTLSSSFQNRGQQNSLYDLGAAIVRFVNVVPQGVLVFFPSYSMMANCIQMWRKRVNGPQSIWDQISRAKTPIVEPKTKAEFAQAMDDFVTKIQDDTLIGAIFFAVCRGKVSEGVDFSDSKGRAVILCGIPFPAAKDPKVMLKKSFLDDLQTRRHQHDALNGQEWYKQQAARAVNQSLGRVIRHRNDYGAILLCDERFGQSSQISQFPVWVRPYVNVYRSFDDVEVGLRGFFKQMEAFKPENKPVVKREGGMRPEFDLLDKGHMDVLRHELVKRFLKHDARYESYINTAGMSKNLKDRTNNLEDTNNGRNSATASPFKTTLDQQTTMQKMSTLDAFGIHTRKRDHDINNNNADLNAKRQRSTSSSSYLDSIKTTLSTNDYKQFQKSLKSYKKTELPFLELLDYVGDLFLRKYSSVELYSGFKAFVPKKYLDEFMARLERCTQ